MTRPGREKTRKTGASHSTESPPARGKIGAAKQHKSGVVPPPGPTLVVGIGASAGGLEAFKAFFTNMPPESGMAFVLVQHLAPDHKSLLADLIGRTTAMRVVEAEDATPVAPNCVYVIPPDATLTIKGAALRVTKPAPARENRRPIDVFFSSLAEDQGENAVCIVLSGTGSDGAVGLTAIKEYGGLTLAQAGFDHIAMSGMPHNATATGLVDHVSPVEDMPKRLVEYQRHLFHVAARKESDGTRGDAATHLTAISTLLRTKLGHDFSQYKEKTLVRRIQRRMQVLQIDTVPLYIARLREEPVELELLFRELLIGVTQFFRDADAFETIRTRVIPKLLENKHADDPLRIWIPACATGQEVYSIAILVREEIERQGATLNVQIFGTDIDDNAVAFARAARYRKPMAGLSPEHIGRWFVEEGDDYCPIKAIREMCVFSTHSVIKDPPFSKLDLVSCRNLLIYLDADLQDRVIRTFHYALRPGGALFLGSSESVTRSATLFAPLDKKQRIFQRSDVEMALPSLPARAPVTRAQALPAARTAPSGDDRLDKYARRTLEKYSPVYVMIDQRHEIVRFSGGEIGLYLGPSAGAASLNLFDILRKPLRTVVRAAVQAAANSKEPVVHNDVALRIDGKSRVVTVIVAPVTEPGAEEGLCVIAFQDTGLASARKDANSGDKNTDANVSSLEQELQTTKTQLQAAIDEYEIVNEEMKSANEEYQSVNEELQSSNEELETSKEEMQSVNEELQTINAEMTSKNDQLTRLNSDLRNLFESTEIGTMFLDNDLRIKSFTPGMTDIFHLREADRGRPITDIVTLLNYGELQRDVKTVLRKLTIVESEVQTADATFIMRIRPYRSVNNVIEGVVITFVDITERRKSEDARRESEARFQTIADNIPILCWMANAEGWIYWYNRRWYEYTGTTPETQEGWGWESVHDPETLPMVMERWKNSLVSGQPFEMVFPLRGTDGLYRPFLTRVVPLRNKEGGVVNWFGTNTDISSQRKIEEALRESEAHYRVLFDLGPVAVYSCDASGLIQKFNRRAIELWGREPASGDTDERFCGSFKLFRPDGSFMPHELCPMAEVLSGTISEARDAEVLIERPDGSRVTVIVNIRPLTNLRGDIIGAINCFYDITERKQAEEARVRLAAIVESSDDAIVSKDLNGVILSWNAGAERLFGYTNAEAVGQHIGLLIPPERADEEPGFLRRIREGERIEHYETVRRCKDGKLLNVSLTVSPMFDSRGNLVGASKIARDITERKQAEAALRENQARLQFTLESARLGDWDLNLIDDTSRRSLRHDKAFGYSKPIKDWGFEQFIQHVHPDDRAHIERQFRDSIAQEKDWHFECRVIWPNGSVHWIEAHGSHYRASDGKPTHMLGIVSNIDERKQAELRTALLMGELDHRVKNILAIVQSVIMQTLKTSPSPGAFASSMEGRIAAIARAHSLLTEKGGKIEASLRAFIETELKPYDHGTNFVIGGAEVALMPKLGLAMAMAIHELASNAAKYGALSTPTGRLAVTWQMSGNGEGRTLNLTWEETGGPAVEQPSRRGFGTTLIERTLQHEFDAVVRREFLPLGLRCTIEIPLTAEAGHTLQENESEA